MRRRGPTSSAGISPGYRSWSIRSTSTSAARSPRCPSASPTPSRSRLGKRRELAVYRKADAVACVSDEDARILDSDGAIAPRFIIPLVVPERPRTVRAREPELLFLGGFRHAPNGDGLLWFVREVWDAVRAGVPSARLTVIGSNPTAEVADLAKVEGIDVIGYVPEVGPYLDRAALMVAPLRFGAGVKTKVAEAMAAGLPVVTTSVGAQGLDVIAGEHLMIADDPIAFARRAVELLADPGRAERVGRAGRARVAVLLSPDAIEARLGAMLAMVAGARGPMGPPWAWWLARRDPPRSGRGAASDDSAGRSSDRTTNVPRVMTGRAVARPDRITMPTSATSRRPPIAPIGDDRARPYWSVMMPVYNCDDLFEEALRSVLDQDPGPDRMQIAVLDDGSRSRRHEEVIRRLAPTRVEVHRHAASIGLARNWNACIARSRGLWVHILHQDDLALPGFYERLARAGAHPEVGAAFSRHHFIDAKGRRFGMSGLERPTAGVLAGWLTRISHSQYIQCPAIVVRRGVYEHLGGFRTDLRYALDWEMWVRIAASYPIWYDPEPLASYRVHEGNETSRLKRRGRDIPDIHRAIQTMRRTLPPEYHRAMGRGLLAFFREIELESAYRALVAGEPPAGDDQPPPGDEMRPLDEDAPDRLPIFQVGPEDLARQDAPAVRPAQAGPPLGPSRPMRSHVERPGARMIVSPLRDRPVEPQEQPLGPEDDLHVLVGQGIFQGRDGDRAQFEQPALGRLARLGGGIAELLDQRPRPVLQPRVDAVDEQQRHADELPGRGEDVEEHGVVQGLARQVRQDDQLARLEQGRAVLVEQGTAPGRRAGPAPPAGGPARRGSSPGTRGRKASGAAT